MPMPTLVIGFGTGGGYSPVTTSDILEVSIRRGRETQNVFLDSGTATVVLNNQSGNYDPSNTSSPWYGTLTAGMQVQITGNGIVIFTGFLEDNVVNQGIYPTVQLTFVDGLAKLGKTIAPALAKADFQESAATRAGRLLDMASWPAGSTYRDLTGTVTMLKSAFGLSVLDHLEQCANVIGGRFYISRTGKATLVPLANKFTRPTQLLFSDQGDAYSVGYDGIYTNPGTDYVYNQAIVFRGSGKNQITITYNPSVSTYGLKTKKLDAPIYSETSAVNLGVYAARKDADAVVLAEQIDFSALNLGVLQTDFLSTELNDQVTVKRLTYDNRAITINGVIEGMAHSITPEDWRVSYFTSVLDPYSITI